ncbi:PREDICTED: CRAL-TRIO domain-containing protein DDB_G0278031-like [Polistes dominula]|uniref:CRAL-TRIO domain-containing protein DDB_G0278031-like n=1 Tax=Polistes dominula TaxID=743375 RepID=A0ABM1IW62_POLDO|nr:PREDICTED: CRAL-TRIO domain-containing protein DDB_G0278031-like [Polistes dominula]
MAIVPTVSYSLEEFWKSNPDIKKSDLQIIRDWLDKESHLPKINDESLLLFFHSNYYRLEPTKTTIENYFTFKTHVPEFFANRDPFLKEIRTQSSIIRVFPVKELTKEGYQMIYADLAHSDPSSYVFYDATKYFLMAVELGTYKVGPVNGLVFITDVQNITLGHVGRINIMGLKKFIYFVQEAAPIRLKQIYVLNWNSAVETLLNIAKPFMKKELYELINLTTVEKLKKFIPFDALPNEIGGKSGNIKDLANKQNQLIDDNREYFLMDEAKNKTNESLRIGKPTFANDLFGVDGSFKKLEID